MPGAAEARSDSINPVLLLNENGEYLPGWNDSLPGDLQPVTYADVVYVVCIGDTVDQIIQVCDYSFGPGQYEVKRHQYTRTYRIRSARTGEMIESGVLMGEPPRECTSIEDISLRDIEGATPFVNELISEIGHILSP